MSDLNLADPAATRRALFDGIAAVAPVLLAQSAIDEQQGTLSPESLAALIASGALRMKLPAVLGGFEADLVTQMEVLEKLATLNASVAWCAMVGATSLALPGAFLPAAGVAQMFAHGVIPCGAIVVTPSGEATPVSGGYRLSGRWSFASGVRHAQWVVALARVPSAGVAAPAIHVLVVPQARCEIIDNWQVSGLQGTGSCDIVIHDAWVPLEMSWQVGAAPHRGGALYGIGLPAFVAYEHAGFALGIARRVLDGVTDILRTKLRGYAPGGSPMATRGAVQRALGHAEMRLRAARALAVEVNEEVWAAASGGGPSLALQCLARSAAVYATEVATEVVAEAFRYAGASAIYRPHYLQGCLRDLAVAAQHYMVSDTAYENLGRVKLGYAEVDPMG
ncbi:MAG: hypothetical protein EXR83_14955 [Gammaproteobacteria bacterium]|nr:hypothetical protein [Gammaproteobacteria bacterium]